MHAPGEIESFRIALSQLSVLLHYIFHYALITVRLYNIISREETHYISTNKAIQFINGFTMK